MTELLAGDIPYADDIQPAFDTDWTAYTPALTAVGGSPAIGNGTLVGRWRQITPPGTAAKRQIIAEIHFVMGSSTNLGTGAIFFSLPLAANANTDAFAGPAVITDTGTTARPGVAALGATASVIQVISPSGPVTASVPQTWAATDVLDVVVCYEPST